MKSTVVLVLFMFLFGNILAEVPLDKDVQDQVNLKEVVVSASRTQTKLIELPNSVSVVNATSLANNEIHTLNQLTAFVPNFFMPDYGTKLTSPVYIRGIGSRINAPSVGLYVDNVPYFEKATFDFDFFDIHKIEVLRGPQGTLFGRNSMGGLINITTKSPLEYQGSQVHLSAGTYGTYRMNVGHYQQLSDRLGYSISANYLHQDGFHQNVTRNETADELDSYGLRFKLKYLINEQWSLDFNTGVEQSSQGGYPYGLYNRQTLEDMPITYNQKSGYDRFLMSNSLKLSYDASSWMLSNTLSHQYLNDNQQLDQDFGPDSLYFAGQLQKQNNFANELLVQSKGDRRYSWLIGAFGFMQNADNVVDVTIYKAPPPTGPFLMWEKRNYLPQVMGAALFHQSSYKVLPQLTLTGGLRLDYEQSSMGYTYGGQLGAMNLAAVDTIYPVLRDTVILPRLSAAWAINKNINVFASYSTGYKPGGFNVTFERPEHLMFKKETSHNYEVGVKAALLRYLYADLAVFYTDIENQQIYRTAPSGRGSYLDNSGLSYNKGFEFSLQNSSFYGFEGVVSYGYTHSEILEYVLSETVNYNNKFTPYIPRHTLAVQATQTIECDRISWIDRVKVNVLYNQTGELYWNLANTLKEESYGILNAKLSFIRKNLQLDFWGKNLTNTYYHAFMFEVGPQAYQQPSRPMQLGANVTVKF